MAPNSGRRIPFFPKADAAILTSKHAPPPTRPQTVGPVFDRENVNRPIDPWSSDVDAECYPQTENYAPATVPERPPCFSDRYLRASLAENERLRLSMLWYYTRDVLKENEFLSGLQEKAYLAQESTGWEFSVIGIQDVDFYIRLATVGLELGILPRGETICAHTVTQPPGSVFHLPNMMEDWRFQESPYVELGGLHAYAGAPLRLQTENGDSVGLGSLCVASSKIEEPLNKSQHQALVRLADWVVSDLVQCARARRQRDRRRMSELLSMVQRETDDTVSEEPVLGILRTIYPDAIISKQPSNATHVKIEGRDPILMSEFEDGIWEDNNYFDDLIANSNHLALPSDKVVRIITAQCECTTGSSLLIVASKDIKLVFDDIDSWFVQSCADTLSQMWRKSLLIEAMKAKEKFLQGVSHQLRTPIHGILGSVELLAEELQSRNLSDSATQVSAPMKGTSEIAPRDPSMYLNIIKMAGRDLTSIVNNMITLNRWTDIAMTDRQYALHTVEELEAEIESEILKLTSGDARYKTSISFTRHLPPRFESFRSDLGVLRDSLVPLIINSIQNTSEGIVSIAISIDLDCKQLTVDVKDTGRGIPVDQQQRIFDSYEKVSLHSAGAGLGLTLSSKFATLLHGSIDLVSSHVGRGSHFRATFRELEFISSNPPQSLASKFINLPSKFFNLETTSDCAFLRDDFTNSLTCNGFIRSDSIEDCIVILDAVPDLELHRLHLSQIPFGQVAICLVPDSEAGIHLERTANNVVYAYGPFSTSIMCSSLEKAQDILAGAELSQPCLQPSNSYISPSELYRDPSTDEDATSRSSTSNSIHSSSDANIPATLLPDLAAFGDLRISTPTFPTSITSPRPITLIVDDNAINLRIIEMYCKKRGLPFYSAMNGQQAVEMFSQRQTLCAGGDESAFQLIFMDLQMPVCDGIEATKQIRILEEGNQWRKSTLFMMTGQDSPSDRIAAEDAGTNEYLVKPVVIKELDRVVKQYFPAFEVI
ncbi:histidine kinase HHK3 [Penicillium verhagenii]|uniref:histidine kinase HHK3 n=1 Tax=Penicillium verhagenii TaxID=1562060 RepID=UPI00254592A9|nr:histidine kinase HHK3 [Penicillium verhagenii]KAJ5938564.1 histidine kinase HHK3 [Penicillium verhagenii]